MLIGVPPLLPMIKKVQRFTEISSGSKNIYRSLISPLGVKTSTAWNLKPPIILFIFIFILSAKEPP
jgi:hypothetical protein